jgi:hypothetical protein
VTDIVAEIAAASREQSQGIDQVNKAVGQMDTTTSRMRAGRGSRVGESGDRGTDAGSGKDDRPLQAGLTREHGIRDPER